jgi:hypothetical protein
MPSQRSEISALTGRIAALAFCLAWWTLVIAGIVAVIR